MIMVLGKFQRTIDVKGRRSQLIMKQTTYI